MILFALLMAILVILLLTKSGQHSKEYAHSSAGKTYPLDYVVDCSRQMWHRLTGYSCESCPYSIVRGVRPALNTKGLPA